MAAKKATTKKWEPTIVGFSLKIKIWADEDGEKADAELTGETERGRATGSLRAGCNTLSTKADAERHWAGGISRVSGQKRPHAAALIAWVDREFKARGYRW